MASPCRESLLSLLGRGRFAAALGLLLPRLSRRLPPRLDAFYAFTGDQDLLWRDPRHPRLSRGDLARVRAALLRLPEPERRLLWGYALLCAARYGRAALALGPRRAGASRDGSALAGAGVLLHAAALWLQGDKLRSRRWLGRALEQAHAAVALWPCREALMLRAQILFELEDKDAGLRDLGLILRRHPSCRAARLGRLEGLADAYRYRPALKEANFFLARPRAPWWAYAQRGRLRGICGRLAGALRDFDESIRRRPRQGALYAWRAEVLRRLGRYQDCRGDLDRALTLDPDYALAWELSGRLRLIEGDARRALVELERACCLDPGRSLALAWRAEAKLKLGRLRQAWSDFRRVLPLDPRRTWNVPAPAEGRAPSPGERETAFWRDIDSAVLRRPADSFAWLLRGRLRASCGLREEAQSDLERARSLLGSVAALEPA